MAAYHRVYDSVTCRLAAKNRDQLRTLRSVIEYGLPFFMDEGNKALCGCLSTSLCIHTYTLSHG